MKVLYIIDTLSLGGAQTGLKGVFEHQLQNQDIYLFALRKTAVTVSIRHPNVHRCRSSSRYSVSPFFQLKAFIKEHQIDLLNCQLPRSQVFGFLLKKFCFPKIRLIIHEHGDIFENSRVLNWFYRRMEPVCERFIACSEATRSKVMANTGIPSGKIAVLYNFVDGQAFNPQKAGALRSGVRDALELNHDDFVVGFAGRLIERKGWQDFLQAASLLKIYPQMKFLLAGAGEDEKKIRAGIAMAGLQQSTRFLGYYSDMLRFYAGIDCFVIPSKWEPMGMTAIEAMACGVAVVASDVPGLNEIVRDRKNGLLFPAGKAGRLAVCIRKVFLQPALREAIVHNGSHAAGDYSLTGFLARLREIYDSPSCRENTEGRI